MSLIYSWSWYKYLNSARSGIKRMNKSMDDSFIESVDGRTKLAGTNNLEVLLFSLGIDSETNKEEIFGINVFKVREVMHVPEITKAPDMPPSLDGIVSLRGIMIPVINLIKLCGVANKEQPKILMVTEYNKNVQGFLVESVDMIQRLSWEQVKPPPAMLASSIGGVITAVTELSDGRLCMIMDVEKVLAETTGFYDDETLFDNVIESERNKSLRVVYVDDSSVARKQIKTTLDKMGFNSVGAINGTEAWKLLEEIAESCERNNKTVSAEISLILTDVEMPEMDGYVLTKKIKDDPRFKDIPVVMHSSLTSVQNQNLGKNLGVDVYVPKFHPEELFNAINKVIHGVD